MGAGFSNVVRGESMRVFLSSPRERKMLGQEMLFEMNYTERHLRPGDILIMGTADLNHVLSEQEIRNIARSTADADEAAERLVSLAQSRFKGDVTPTLGMGCVVLHLGDFTHEQEAREGKAFQSAPVLHHYINSGQEYLKQGDIERAIEEFQKGLKINPDAFSVNYELALAHLKKGSTHTAEQYCQRAIELFPSFIDGYCTLGDIKATNRLWYMAEEKYLSAIEFGPNNPSGYISLGDFYFGRGRLLLARMTYQRGLNSVKSSPELQQRLDRVSRMLKNPLYWLVAGWNGFWAALTPKKRG
jgi:tetratricopeptide (TPR) repeat protein